MLHTVNTWIENANGILGKATHIPLINDERIEMTELEDAWMYGDHALRAALDNVLSRDPDDLAARFVALNAYYRLETLKTAEEEEDVEDQRQQLREHLGYLVRLRDESRCNDFITIRWEIVNACAVNDFDRAVRICEQLNGQLPAQDAQTLRGRLHFLIGVVHTWTEESLEHWDLPLGPPPDGMRGVWGSLNTVLLYTAGIPLPERAALTEDDKDHLRDAIKHLEKTLATPHAVPPSTRFLLARSYASIGDGHNAAKHYTWMLDHSKAFLQSCAEEAGPFWTSISNSIVPGFYRCLVNAYDDAGDIDKAISATTDWIALCPDHLGTFERMARLYQKRGDFAAAYKWLRKEADRNPTFGEDPNISIALAIGGITSPSRIDESLKALATTHPHEHSLVASVVLIHWATFAKLHQDAKEQWVNGSWLLGTNAPHGAGLAAYCFAWVVERELRNTVFAPFAEHARQHPELMGADADDETRIFSRYLKGYDNITLGKMFKILRRAQHPRSHLIAGFAQWLKSGHPWLLAGLPRLPTGKIIRLRNREAHADMKLITETDAEAMAMICRDVINTLHPTR